MKLLKEKIGRKSDHENVEDHLRWLTLRTQADMRTVQRLEIEAGIYQRRGERN